ncbi:MAG: AI-2E family transporter [Nitrospinae bacterium]|nr:AI-2E family transporter [Nitrospinota bacterium]
MNQTTAETRVIATCLVVITFIALGFALAYLKPVLAPFTLSLLFVLALNPFIDVLEQKARLSHALSVVITLVVAAALLLGFGAMLSVSVVNIAENADVYRVELTRLMESMTRWFPSLHLENGAGQMAASLPNAPLESLNGFIAGFVGGLFNLLSNGFLILVFSMFLLVGQATRTDPEGTGLFPETLRSVQRYLMLKAAVSAATGLLHGLILWALGVKFAFIFGVLAGLLNFIPTFGPVIAVLAPLPFLPLSPDLTIVTGSLAIILPSLLHFTGGSAVEPRIFGGSLDLSPVTILLSLIFFGMIWGVVGMFISTPLTGALKIALEKSDYTRPVALFMAGRVEEALGGMKG